MAKFEITLREDKGFQFRLRASSGQVILSSEGYVARTSCLNGVLSVRNNSPKGERYERKESENGKYFFNLKATNGQVIGTSEMYETAADRDSGIESVKKNAPVAEIDDQT